MSLVIASPLAGWATSLADVPDPVFAEKMLGDGVAIDPVEGRLLSPGAGVVVSVHPAGHAVTLQLDTGPVLLMHIGLETVGLGGEGFAPKVADGQRVAAGELLVEFDLDRLARTAKSLITPVIVTNGDAFAVGSHNYSLHQTYHVQCDAYGCDWANAYSVTDATIDSNTRYDPVTRRRRPAEGRYREGGDGCLRCGD